MADPTAASAPPATGQTNVSVTLGGKWADRKKKSAEIAREEEQRSFDYETMVAEMKENCAPISARHAPPNKATQPA